jgi:hypothetical protein
VTQEGSAERRVRPDLKVHVAKDDEGKVRQVFHTDERWLPSVERVRRAG